MKKIRNGLSKPRNLLCIFPIEESNNVFVYSPDNSVLWVKIRIPEGSYETDDINIWRLIKKILKVMLPIRKNITLIMIGIRILSPGPHLLLKPKSLNLNDHVSFKVPYISYFNYGTPKYNG